MDIDDLQDERKWPRFRRELRVGDTIAKMDANGTPYCVTLTTADVKNNKKG